MSRRKMWLAAWGGVTLCIVMVTGGCKTAPDVPDESVEPTGPFAELQNKVPKSDELLGWKRSGKMQILLGQEDRPPAGAPGTESIEYPKFAQSGFAGEAPLFAEYRHRVTAVQAYQAEEGDATLTLEIHEMNNADEAYGLLSVAAVGEPLVGSWGIGQKTPTAICFAKDRYLVRIRNTSAAVTDDKPAAMLANAVAMKVFGRGRTPAVVANLPALNQIEGTLVYLHGPLGLKKAEARLGVEMAPILGPVLGNAPMAAATYRPPGGNDNTVFIINRRLATQTPPLTALDEYMARASTGQQNRFAYTAAENGYVVVGTFNPEEESIQRVIRTVVDGL